MKKLFLFLAFVCSMQMMALNLVVENRSGAEAAQDLAVIGKWVYEGDNLVLLDKEGNRLATERLSDIKKITFAVSGPVTDLENSNNHTILVYPNPTKGLLLIQGIESQALRVYDLQGRLLIQEEGTQVDVNHLANGTYLLQIGTQVVRFIKK
ncbi:MAG: T9SS type A sorting domain-containing protein [Paludibacteraceae bacterium]|nr:T9SS type A sorting domain-containing protein [Paludibacteraceae bacterium]